MQRRFVAAIAAVVLAGLGATMLYFWVNGAEARALAGTEPQTVLVATQDIPAGTSGSELSVYTELKAIPSAALVPGALTSAESVADLATTSKIAIGEQVISDRFGEPGTTESGEIEVPGKLQTVSIQLDASRISHATAGSLVSVFYSGEDVTGRIISDVLVISVENQTPDASSGSLTVTLAVNAEDAGKIIFANDFGKLYLTSEPTNGSDSGDISIKNPLK